jgi:DNA-directed RNA polymerase subunit H (RpoH/RPB5)
LLCGHVALLLAIYYVQKFYHRMQDTIRATVRMLWWRGLVGDVLEPEIMPFLQTLVPNWVNGCSMRINETGTVVVVTDASRITFAMLKNVLEALDGQMGLLLVSRNGVATQNQNLVTHATRLHIVAWTLVLLYPLDHQLVPRHRKATVEDLKLLPRGTLRRPSCLPAIRSDDAIVQYLGLKVGDIVRIDRLDHTVYFRMVISSR